MLPFPCRSEVILAPFLSSPQWDAPVSLMQAEMLPNTTVGRGAAGGGFTAPARVYPRAHGTPGTLGDRLSTAGPALELSVHPAKGDGIEPQSHPSEHVASGQGKACAAGSLDPGAGFSPVSSRL